MLSIAYPVLNFTLVSVLIFPSSRSSIYPNGFYAFSLGPSTGNE